MLHLTIFSILILLTLKITCVKALTEKNCTITDPISAWRKEDYPNPRVDAERCGRNCRKSWICDPSNIIPTDEADRLDKVISRIASSGKCKCSECSMNDGYNISIALVPRMISTGYTKRVEARKFADYLRMKWNFQKCGNNVLIFISKHDRQVYTTAGPEAYTILTLKKIHQVYKEVHPILARGEFTAGLAQMLTRYEEIFANEYTTEDDSYSHLEIVIICLVILFVLSIIGCCCFYHLMQRYCKKEEPKLSEREQKKQSENILRDYYKNRKYKPTIVYETKTEHTSPSRTNSSSRKGGGRYSSYSSRTIYSSRSRSSYDHDRYCSGSYGGGGGGGSSGFSGGSSCDGGGGGGGDF